MTFSEKSQKQAATLEYPASVVRHNIIYATAENLNLEKKKKKPKSKAWK